MRSVKSVTADAKAISDPTLESSGAAECSVTASTRIIVSEDTNRSDTTSLLAASAGDVRRLLVLFVVLKIAGSFDSGAFSAALGADNGITDDLGLSTTQQGTLGSSVFLGNIVGCAIAGHMFSVYKGQKVLASALALHAVSTILFASVESYNLALVCRFAVGATLAFIVVYTPLWVDEFAPKQKASSWMAFQNAGVPIGIMFGYVLGGLVPGYTDFSWKWPFYLKAAALVPVIAAMARVDGRLVDIKLRSSGVPSAAADLTDFPNTPQPGIVNAVSEAIRESITRSISSAKKFAQNGIFVCCVLAMSSLYFVVTGLQTFAMPYLRADPFNASPKDIVLGFGFSVVSAPVFGVVAGGLLLDRIGGYHGNMHRASAFACAWATAAAFMSIFCIFATSTSTFLVVVWLMLFCGGAVVPPTSGLILASLPENSRAAGSSISTVVFNLLGNFLGPIVCGWVADRSGSLALGVQLVLSVSLIGVIPMALCIWFAKRVVPPPGHSVTHYHYHPASFAGGGTEGASIGDEDQGVGADDAVKFSTAGNGVRRTASPVIVQEDEQLSSPTALLSDDRQPSFAVLESPAEMYAAGGFNQHSFGLNLVHQIRHLHSSADSFSQSGTPLGPPPPISRQDSVRPA